VLEYRAVFLAYLGLALGNVVRLSWRYAGVAVHPTLAFGLRLVALGGLAGLGYVANEGVRVVAARLGLGDLAPGSETLTRALIAGAIGLTVVGSTLPAWGPQLGIARLSRWVGRYWSYRQLYPLWLALYRASPEIALLPPPSAWADALTVRDLGFRLYRRVVEIRDGCLALRPYLAPGVAEHAGELCRQAGLVGDRAAAEIEAAGLAAALAAKTSGRRAVPTPGSQQSAVVGGSDLESEVASLKRVARCYQRSPIVRAALAWQQQAHTALNAPAAEAPAGQS
jgi:hypothetical protein